VEYRIVELYRPQTGKGWWLQCGEWFDSDGAVAVATGKGRRFFKVNWEEPYPSRAAAESRLSEEALSAQAKSAR
jgi:hypothetical protein